MDRILKREREAKEAAKAALISETSDVQKGSAAPIPNPIMRPGSSSEPPLQPSSPTFPGSFNSVPQLSATREMTKGTEPLRSGSSIMQNLKQKLNNITDQHRAATPTVGGNKGAPTSTWPPADGPRPNDSVVTPQSNIGQFSSDFYIFSCN